MSEEPRAGAEALNAETTDAQEALRKKIAKTFAWHNFLRNMKVALDQSIFDSKRAWTIEKANQQLITDLAAAPSRDLSIERVNNINLTDLKPEEFVNSSCAYCDEYLENFNTATREQMEEALRRFGYLGKKKEKLPRRRVEIVDANGEQIVPFYTPATSQRLRIVGAGALGFAAGSLAATVRDVAGIVHADDAPDIAQTQHFTDVRFGKETAEQFEKINTILDDSEFNIVNRADLQIGISELYDQLKTKEKQLELEPVPEGIDDSLGAVKRIKLEKQLALKSYRKQLLGCVLRAIKRFGSRAPESVELKKIAEELGASKL